VNWQKTAASIKISFMKQKIGILLVNLGTPDAPSGRAVYRYLIEFLTDERVIDIPWWKRQLLVRGVIVPFRYRQSTKYYKSIWTDEGSPLKVYGQRVKTLLQKRLGDEFHVELAMRYQNPSIAEGLQALLDAHVEEIRVIALFPQYASATSGSVYQKVMEVIKHQPVIPKMTFVDAFATHPALIEAFAEVAKDYPLADYDHVLFSYHGLPERQLKKADRRNWCLKTKDCCKQLCLENRPCYSAQCYATTAALVSRLGLAEGCYSVAFQSRLGREPWLQPYTGELITQLAKQGKKKVLVFCPAFVCDCLETLFEIGEEYAHEFKQAGGERLQLVRGLNDHPKWIEALEQILLH
jgi:ferrochelatase